MGKELVAPLWQDVPSFLIQEDEDDIIITFPEGQSYEMTREKAMIFLRNYGAEFPDHVLDFLHNFKSILYEVRTGLYKYYRPGKRSLAAVISKRRRFPVEAAR